MENWIKLLAPLLAIIMLAAAFAGCTDDGDDDGDGDGGGSPDGDGGDGGDGVTTLNLAADLETNPGATAANLTIEQRGGDKITWADYAVRLDGNKLTGPTDRNGGAKPTSEVGDKTVWNAGAGYIEDEDYKVQIIDGSDKIVWEKTITAKLFG
jgi:hypothetical protein